MINYENLVSINEVAKQCKKIGEFIMFKCKSGNLLVTNKFVLNLTIEQFWKVQCKLEIPELGKWYTQGKGKVEESNREVEIEKLERQYLQWITAEGRILEYTQLILLSQYYIYTEASNNNGLFTALSCNLVNMIINTSNKRRVGDIAIIDTYHVISVAKDDIWRENEFLNQ